MKFIVELFKYILISVVILILLLVAVAELSEDAITDIALKRINKDADVRINVEDVDFSFIRDFPVASIGLRNVKITTNKTFEDTLVTSNDTLAQIDNIFVSVEILPLLDSKLDILKVAIDGGISYYTINQDGSTNFDAFLTESEETSPDTSDSQINLKLDNLDLKDLSFLYNDKKRKEKAFLYIDNLLARFDINDSITSATVKGQLRTDNLDINNTNLHLMKEAWLDIDADYINDSISIRNIALKADGAFINSSGYINLKKTINTDIHISESAFNLGELKKFIPDSLIKANGIKYLDGYVNMQGTIKGEYNDSIMPHIVADFQLNRGKFAIADYPAVQNLKLVGKYSNGKLNNNQTTNLNIDTLSFHSGESYGVISGSLKNLDKLQYAIRSNLNLNLNDIEKQLPDSLLNNIDGRVQIYFATSGVLPDKITDSYTDYLLVRSKANIKIKNLYVEMDSLPSLNNWNANIAYNARNFSINNLYGSVPEYNLNLKEASFNGSYNGSVSNTDKISLDLPSFNILTDGFNIYGSTSIKNIGNPEYKIDSKADFNLAEIQKRLPDSLVKNMSGNINAHFKSSGHITPDSIADQAMSLIFNNSSINTSYDNVNIVMPDTLLQIKNLSGQVSIENDSIALKNIKGDYHGITFGTKSTIIANIYNAVLLNTNDTVKVDGYFDLGDLDYAILGALMSEDSISTEPIEADTTASEPANYRYLAKGAFKVNSLKYKNAAFNNIGGLYNVSDSLYIIDKLKMDAFDGKLNTSVSYEIKPDDITVTNIMNHTEGVDINKLLIGFDNFKEYDAEYVTHKQLSGTFSTPDSLFLSYKFIGDSIDMNSIMMSGNLKLEDGRLTAYPLAAEMGKEYNIPNLDDMQFETIDTEIFIYKNATYIPQTDIKSNTFDITIFGMQNFNEDCEYHLRFYFKELLRRKETKRTEKKQKKKGKDEYGGTKGLTSLFVYYKIIDSKDDFWRENKDSYERKRLKTKIKLQKKGLKITFHPKSFNFKTAVKIPE